LLVTHLVIINFFKLSVQDFFPLGSFLLSFETFTLLLMVEEARAKEGDHALLNAGIHDLLKVKALLLGDQRLVVTFVIFFFLLKFGGLSLIIIIVRVVVRGICRRDLYQWLSCLYQVLYSLLLLQ
jgi:hypothetical protein